MSFKAVLILSCVVVAVKTNLFIPINCYENPHEIYACGSPCQTECATLGQPCRKERIRCSEDCFCIDGYARNASGICIPMKNCPKNTPFHCSQLPNEHYEDCGSQCQKECATLEVACEDDRTCIEGCFCNKGYARNSCGECIPEDDCPKTEDFTTVNTEIYEH